MIRIGDLSARAGVSVRALRYYEEQGLLKASRSASGQRHYAEYAVERVLLIQQLYSAGLSSRTIAQLMPCVDANQADEESTALLISERDRIEHQIQELISARDRLNAVIASTLDAESCLPAPDDAAQLVPAS